MPKKNLTILEITKDNVRELVMKGSVKITTKNDTDFLIITNPNYPLSKR